MWCAGAQAKRRMTKSTVVDNETGKSVDSTVRTSTGTFYGRGEDEVSSSSITLESRPCVGLQMLGLMAINGRCRPCCACCLPTARAHAETRQPCDVQIIARIERRISHISFLPVENGEGLQVIPCLCIAL